MKILMLTSRFGFGYGMGYSAYKEAKELVSLGHSVTVVHCFSHPEITHFYDPQITFVYLPISPIPLLGFLRYSFKLKNLLKKKVNTKDFDCVYIQSLEFGLLDFKKIKTPIFYFARSTMRGMDHALQKEKIKKSLFSKIIYVILVALERRCMHYSKKIFVKSSRMVGEVTSLYGIQPDKLVEITGGIDSKDFQKQSESACVEFKRKLGTPLNVPIVLYAGRIVPQKGLAYLIEASLQLLSEINFAVVVAGAVVNKTYDARVKQCVDHSMYQKCFYFLGHVNQRNMSFVLNSADCLVSPSFYEPFGMINLQAAFLNKNIITTNVTGSVDLLASYPKMKVVKAGSTEAIRLALEEVLRWKNRKDHTSVHFQVYSWRNVARQLICHFSKGIKMNEAP